MACAKQEWRQALTYEVWWLFSPLSSVGTKHPVTDVVLAKSFNQLNLLCDEPHPRIATTYLQLLRRTKPSSLFGRSYVVRDSLSSSSTWTTYLSLYSFHHLRTRHVVMTKVWLFGNIVSSQNRKASARVVWSVGDLTNVHESSANCLCI